VPGRQQRSPRGGLVPLSTDSKDEVPGGARSHGVASRLGMEGARVEVGANQPNVVLCDIGLPGMSGYEVAQALRATAAEGMQLIAVSGYAQPEDVKRAIEAGFDAHVAKPCAPEQIEELLS